MNAAICSIYTVLVKQIHITVYTVRYFKFHHRMALLSVLALFPFISYDFKRKTVKGEGGDENTIYVARIAPGSA